MEKLKLKHSIYVNNVERKELTYDFEEITSEQYLEACANSALMDKNNGAQVKLRENDHALHLQIAMQAVIAINPEIDLSDLQRMKGADLMNLGGIGRNFILNALADSEGENSDSDSETTAKPFMLASENSGECD